MKIDWTKTKLVIFDVDGTLYHQSRLRKKMGKVLLSHYLLRPWNAYDLQIIRVFRKERELMNLKPLKNIEEAQYQLCADKLKVPAPRIKNLIEKWMHQAPLPYLRACSYGGVQEFFKALKSQGIKTAIYSDYPAVEKLQALDLQADLVVASTDSVVDALKPDPEALTYIMKKFNFAPEECLFIGDRDELDGACARSVGMPYYILSEKDKESGTFYTTLAKSLPSAKNLINS